MRCAAGTPRPASRASAAAPARSPPALREEWARETQDAAGRSAGPAEGAGRRSSASGPVTPPWSPPLGAGLAGGRGPRSRPSSAGPGGTQISARVCTRSGRDQTLHPSGCLCFAPRAGRSLSPTGDGERSDQVVACSGSRRRGYSDLS